MLIGNSDVVLPTCTLLSAYVFFITVFKHVKFNNSGIIISETYLHMVPSAPSSLPPFLLPYPLLSHTLKQNHYELKKTSRGSYMAIFTLPLSDAFKKCTKF